MSEVTNTGLAVRPEEETRKGLSTVLQESVSDCAHISRAQLNFPSCKEAGEGSLAASKERKLLSRGRRRQAVSQ